MRAGTSRRNSSQGLSMGSETLDFTQEFESDFECGLDFDLV
jgi:hypothetical protein